MKIRKSIVMLVFIVSSQNFLVAQTPESFFPSQVGNLWQYINSFIGTLNNRITRDSLAQDGNLFLFYNNAPDPRYLIDTLGQVIKYPGDLNLLELKLHADSGDIWVWEERTPHLPSYAWIASIDSGVVFGRWATIKIVRYGPHYPDSMWWDFWYYERYFASGFGWIWEEGEAGDVTYLRGCVIAGDTFGTVVSVPIEKQMLPTNFKLYQNYPNPFNSSTTIRYYLPKETNVSLRIYNLLGQEIACLVEEIQELGIYQVAFDASSLPTGVYTYILRAGNFMMSRRMIILK
jgi:hypothetical protein